MNSVFSPYLDAKYRNDIQGIRAIGALMIMVYHIWLQKVSGGVDVFFVVSGFLMGGLLIRQFAREGKIRVFQFWGSIIKRVAPSAYIVLLVTLIAAYFLMPPNFFGTTVDEIIFSAFHVENFQLIRLNANYLQSATPASPVQQFWALSMQIQFYALLPFILIPACLLSKKTKSLAPLLLTTLAVIAVSFYLSLSFTATDPSAAYFHTKTRVWEFFAGIFVALVLPFIRINSISALSFGAVGLCILLLTGLVVPRSINFPGYIALLPAMGAIFLVLAGHGHPENPIAKLLGSRPLVAIGDRSFTIYLWHWPILVFTQHYLGTSELSLFAGIAIIAAAIALAFVTSQWVEFRFKKMPKTKVLRNYAIGIGFFALAAGPAIATKLYFNSIIKQQTAEINSESFKKFNGDQLSQSNTLQNVSKHQFWHAKFDMAPAAAPRCDSGPSSGKVIACEFGDVKAERKVVLVGGSHASQWQTFLSEVAKKEPFKLIVLTKSSCSFGLNFEGAALNPACEAWNQNIVERIITEQPDLVVTNSTRVVRASDAIPKEYVPEGYATYWKQLIEQNIPVLGIRDNAWFGYDPNACLWDNRTAPENCAVKANDVLAQQNPAKKYEAELEHFYAVDFNDTLCPGGNCVSVANDRLVWRDRHHFTHSFMRFVSDKLYHELQRQVPMKALFDE